MTEPTMLLAFPEVFDVVDIEHPERLDWRRCALSLWRTATGKAILGVRIHNKTTGRHAHDLFEGVFVAGIEALARAILAEVPGLAEPHMLGTGFLYRGGSRGYSMGNDSATISYHLPDHVAEAVFQLQGHTTMRVLDKARQLAQRQARIRDAAPG